MASDASDETSKVSDGKKSDTNADYNPKLDFYSEHFDPLLALKTPDLVVPVSNAKTYDNIQKYKTVVEDKLPEKRTNIAKTPVEIPIQRRWLPHQLPIQRQRKAARNVLTRMENAEGPLQRLKICTEKRQRIKVWTRHTHDIRGYCTAYVIAFDKHWNLALEDVEEVWTRSKRRKIPALDTAKVDFRIQAKVLPPPVTILKSTKKTETCSRHVNQLLLRGEHIAYIVVIPDESKHVN